MFGYSGIRIASIIIGIIFIIGLIVVANRFGGQIRQKLQTTEVASSTITPSPKEKEQPETFGQIINESKGEITYTAPSVEQIPDTGAETLIIPGLVSLFGLGLYFRKSA